MAEFFEIYIDQGSDFSQILTLNDEITGYPLNVSNYLVTSNAKTSYISPNVAFSFTCSITDAPNGNVSLVLPGSTSSNVKAGRYVFDVKTISPSNTVARIIQGLIDINPSVS